MHRARTIVLFSLASACLMSLFLSDALHAQGRSVPSTGVIRGRIADSVSGEGTKGAHVRVAGTTVGAIAGTDGTWLVRNVPAGDRTIDVTYLGYRRALRRVRVPAGDTVECTVLLVPQAVKTTEVVVSANKRVQAVQDVPLSIAVIDAAAIGDRTATKLDEVLRYVPGVNVSQNQVNIRGASGFAYGLGSRTTLLLDNFPLLSADNADMSFDALPLFATERIEVVKGSGSALYGSSAIGGVVNVITKDPQGDAAFKLRLVQGVYTRPRYDEWDWSKDLLQQRGADLSYGQAFGKSSVIATAGIRTDDTHLQSNDSRRSNLYAKFATEPTTTSRFMVFGQFAYEDRANWVNWRNVRFATTPAVSADSGLRIFSNKAAVGAEWTERLSTTSFLVGRLSRFQTWYRNTAPRDSGSFMSSDAGASVAEVQITSQVLDAVALTCGVTGSYNDVVSPQTRGPKTQSFLSAYVQSEWNIGSRCITTFGVRYDRESTVGEAINNEISPKFGVSYKLGDAGALRANIGRAFRAPAVLERFASIRFSGFTVGRNPLLRPETGWSAEIGGDYSFNVGPLPVSFEAAVFQNDLTNLIEPQFVVDATRSEIQFINITQARIQGVEAALRTWLMKGLGIETSVLAMSPQNLTTGRDLLFRHNIMWTSRIMASVDAWGFQMDYRYLSRQVEVDERLGNLGLVVNADVRVPVHVVDARILFNAESALSLPMRFTLNARNIFDYYYVEVPGNLAPTRSLSLQADISL